MRVPFSWLLFPFVATIVLGCRAREHPQTATAPTLSPPSGEVSYAAARARFRTRLLRQGSSPEPSSARPFSKLDRPDGVQEVDYRSGELHLKAWAQAPVEPGNGKLPAVLFLHGGWGFDEGDWEHTRPFRDAGFVVLAPVGRGENGCPGHFTMFYDEVDDVVAVGKHLAAMPQVDPQRVFLVGYSAGGTLAMLAAMTTDQFRAVAALDGSPNRRPFAAAFKDDVPFDIRDEEELRMRSAVDFPTSFRCPVRLFCSTDENPYTPETRQIAQAAKAKGLDVEVVMVRGDHGTFRLPASKQAIEFFRKQK